MPGSVEQALSPVIERLWSSTAAVDVTVTVLGPGRSVLLQMGPRSVRAFPGAGTQAEPVAPARKFGSLFIPGLVVALAGLVAAGGGVFALTLADQPRAELAAAMRDASGRITSLTQRRAFELDASANTAWQVAGGLLIGGALAVAAGVTMVVFGGLTVSAGPSSVALTVPLSADFSAAVAP